MHKSMIISIVLVIASFLIAIASYSLMPDTMASHWNAKGEPDGYMTKFWGLFLMPFVSVILFTLFLVLIKIDPLEKNIENLDPIMRVLLQ